MPIFSDMSLYYGGPSTSFPSSFYTNHVPSYNLPLTSYTPRGGVFSGFSSGLSLVNQPHRLLPTPPRVNKYSPLLPTISETKSLSAIPRRPLPRISSPRVVPAYRAPKPININTADIDVTTPRKRTDRISRDRDDPQHGTIKRGRTVVRLHTKRLIENSGSAQSRRKTPGERLVEKFLIRDKAAEEAKRRKIEEEENRLKHVYKDPGLVEIKDTIVENESCNTARRKSIQDCLQEMEGLIDLEEEEKEFLATQQAADEEEPVVMQVTQSEALDLLLSETENEALVIATKPEPAPEPEPPPNTTAKQKEPAEKANTAKKRPRKRDESKIKKADHKSDDMIQPPVEKSLLQRRNTVKKLRRNSRDLTLDLSVDSLGCESSVSSTPGGSMFSTPSSSSVPTPTNSMPLTPGGSTLLPGGSAASTPNGLTLPTPVETTPACSTPTVVFESNIESVSLVEMRKPAVPTAQSSNRDMFPFKTKVSDKSSAPIISNKISVDVSVENADDVFKKSPLKFVVDEIKVEESTKSPKSPKLLRYEVTVEEIADKEESFQKQILGAFSSASDGSSTPTEIRGANETDVAFWNTEDAEAHKLSKLVKNLSKVNEKEREKKDCFLTPESTEKTFPATNKETQNKQNNVQSVNNISATQGDVEQKFQIPNLNETQNKNKIKSGVKETAIRTKVNENRANLYAAEQKKNETNSQKTIKNEDTSMPEKAVNICKCEVTTGVFAAETPKVPLITQFISQSAETKVGQDIDSKVLASYPKWGENSDDSTSKLRKILEESGRNKDGDVKNTTSDGTKSKFPFTSNLKDEQNKYGATRIGQKIEIIPKTPPSPEVIPPSNSGENNFRRLDDSKLKDGSVSSDVSSTLGNSGNEKEKNKQTLTIASKNINIPSLSKTDSEQEAEGSSKISGNLLENNKVPKLEIKTFTTKQELKKDVQNLKKVTLTNKDTTDKRETGIVKTQDKDTLDKDINNKKTTESSKTANSNQKSETTSATGPKDEQSGIPAWKKALIAKAQASNACKVQGSVDVQKKNEQLKSTPKLQMQNKDNRIALSASTSTETTPKSFIETPVIKSESSPQETKSPTSLPTNTPSEITNQSLKPEQLEATGQDQIGKPKSSGADTACKNSTAEEVKQQSYESKLTGAKQKVQETKNKDTEKQKSDEALSSGEEVKTFGKVSAEKPSVSAVSQVNNGKTKTDETNVVENKIKSGEPLPTEESKTNETKLVDNKLKSNEKAPIQKTKATEEKLDESKPKSAHITLPDNEIKITDSMPESPKTSLVDKIKLSKTHMTESKQTSSPLEKTKPAEIKSPNFKLKSADTSPAKEKADTTKSGKKQKYCVGKTEATGIKSVDKKQISVETFPVEKKKSAEIETPSTVPAPAEETREAERKVPKPGQKPQALKSKATETSATDKPEPIGTKPKLQKSKPKERRSPEKKLLSTKANIVGQTNPSVTPALDKEKSGVASTEEEDTDSPRDDTTADPKSSEPKDKAEPRPETAEKEGEEESSSGEEETDSEEETETETDDGEEVTPASQRTSTSSSEDSGFDSLPTSVPGSPAYNKKGPASKAPSCSSGSSVDSAPSPSLSSNPALGLDPYDDNSPPSTLARGGRVTPPATTIPRFRKYTVEDFQFLKVLGKGSFGKVLLAELKGTECYYAVKCLKKDVVLEDDDVECTLIERKVLALGTKHPYLCHLFCTFQTESHLFFVMEYLNGGDLMFHIQQSGRFPEPRARFYAAEIVSGLKFLHKKGVVYRDLKLDNILLDFDGHVRIADFGMCKLQIYLDRTADTFCGTPDYMAPEIIKGLKYNQCVDWWSFGILLYEMLIGQSPFSGCDEDDLFWSICNEQPHFPRFLSREANGILSLLLEKDSSKRLGTNECIAGDVMDQPFFRNMDWNALEHRDLEPPFKPRVQHPLDVQYFDKAFTAERAKLTPVEREILQSMDQTQFQGFSYTNPNATD